MGLLEDKICVITGGTSGIGYAVAVKFAAEGAIVYACARHEKVFENSRIIYHYLDVTDVDSCRNLYEYILTEHGRIDVLVADAGITRDALTRNMSEAVFSTVINTNLTGVFNIVKFIGSHMEAQGYGSIVAMSSIVGEYGNIGQVNYAASKAGVIAMCKSWAKEFARKGGRVRVNVVAPGYILTDMLKTVPSHLLEKFAGMTVLKRLGKPEEVAELVAFLSSDAASYITGAVIDINGGMRL